MNSPQMGSFIFPTPIQETGLVNKSGNSFLRIKVYGEIPSHYKGEKVVAFLESANENTIYILLKKN